MPMFSPSKYGDGTAEAAEDLFQGFTFTNRGQYMS